MSSSTRTTTRIGAASFLGALAAGAALMFTPGCSNEDPCQDYIDYVCDCGDPTCDSVTNTYSDADSKLQDECENALQDLQDADDAAGSECASLGSDTGA
jgi:hypothetical protein